MISCVNITKQIRNKDKVITLLDDVSLEIDEGEFIIVTGSLGSGKTTLLNILAGRDRATSGEYWLLGTEMTTLKQRELIQMRSSQIGYCSLETTLIPGLNVLENLLAPIAFFRNDALEQVEEMSARFGLKKYLDKKPNELSKGERLLVSLVASLIHMPRILILDEIFLCFDHPLSVKIMSIIQELSLDHQITTIIAERDVRLHPFAHRLVRMKEGTIYEILGEAVSGITPPFMQI